jgi:hypothetical protein
MRISMFLFDSKKYLMVTSLFISHMGLARERLGLCYKGLSLKGKVEREIMRNAKTYNECWLVNVIVVIMMAQ